MSTLQKVRIGKNMISTDRAKNVVEVVEGDDRLVTDGRVNQMNGHLKQAGEKAKASRKVAPLVTP
jgi:hypothetical protein